MPPQALCDDNLQGSPSHQKRLQLQSFPTESKSGETSLCILTLTSYRQHQHSSTTLTHIPRPRGDTRLLRCAPLAPASLLPLISTILLAPSLTFAFPPLDPGVPYSQLFERGECGGQACGWNNQVCCEVGFACYTDSSNQAQCSSTAAGSVATAGAGQWNYITTTYVETDLQTITSTISSYVAGAGGWAQPTSSACDYTTNQTPCGDICCESNGIATLKGIASLRQMVAAQPTTPAITAQCTRPPTLQVYRCARPPAP